MNYLVELFVYISEMFYVLERAFARIYVQCLIVSDENKSWGLTVISMREHKK